MYSDEIRSREQLRKLRVAERMTDPEGVYAQLERLTDDERQHELTKMEADRQDLKRRAKKAQQALEQLKKQNAVLVAELKTSQDKLQAIRKSKSMRVGRAITSPARFGRRLAKNPSATVLESFQEFSEQIGNALRETKKQANILSPKKRRFFQRVEVRTRNATKNETASLISPLTRFATTRDANSAEAALNYLWFNLGSYHKATEFATENANLVEEMSEKGRQLAARAVGATRVAEGITIPARSRGAAYVVEPDRVMYCVNQSPVFNSNGYSTRTRGVAQGMKAAGLDVVVVARSGYPWDSRADSVKPEEIRNHSLLDGIDYVHLPGGNLNRDPFDRYIMQCADAFVREARMQRPALIQSASNFRTALPALIASRRLGVPFVYEVRGLWELTEASAKPGFEETERFELMKSLETQVANEADAVLAITNQVRDELIHRGIPAEKISVVPNAVDPNVFLPLPTDVDYAKAKNIRTDVPVIGFAGSMVDYEGLDLLLQASAMLHDEGVDHQVVFAGSGSAEPELKELAKQLDLGENLRFLGRLPQETMSRLQSTFDIVACPRRSNVVTELVSPLKPLESFATGKATVLSSVAPNVDLAGPDETRALLCDADDAGSLAAALRRVIEDTELRADLGRTARLWAVKHRTWASVGELMRQAQDSAGKYYLANTLESRPLSSLKVGVIGDEFTRTTLESAFNVELLSRKDWRDQLESTPKFDLIFIESAWEGNNGEWHRGVGHYSANESADLRALLKKTRDLGIPTAFWNKEDPVHFARFAPNAALIDHVFTTDANMIPEYMATPGQINKSVSAMPFYAQPKLHNPLPTDMLFKESIAYAGTYYGDRYKDRSQGLDKLLAAAGRYPLDIYDRQASFPDSPYKFPAKYRDSVRGALPYREVIKSYSAHIAHLNVNSVLNSPTMFSRRVVEIPACGGVVMSAYGRGIAETFGSNIANSASEEDYRAWLYDWATDPQGRLEEIWRQMRTIFRSHTTESALAIMARTCGIPVDGLQPIAYVALIADQDLNNTDRAALLKSVALQSIRPIAIVGDFDCSEASMFEDYGIKVLGGVSDAREARYSVEFGNSASRTFAEDILLPTRFGEYGEFWREGTESYSGTTSVVSLRGDESQANSYLVARSLCASNLPSVTVTLPSTEQKNEVLTDESQLQSLSGRTVLIAGHDLKFAGFLVEELKRQECNVIVDKWESHTKHSEELSLKLLSQADIVFCEWGLGNAVWYSKNVSDNQRLFVRVHSQELFRPFLKDIVHENVDSFIFVGELIRSAAVTSHGIPSSKTVVIPNPVDVDALSTNKHPNTSKTIGFVGMVPRSKRLDRALDVLESILEIDGEYVLRIKGKTPADYPWMKNRPAEMEYFEKQFLRIEELNKSHPGCVILDGFGNDMTEWYRNIGIVLSTSEFESFHLTIADGAASGALPVCLSWPGADRIYPLEWISGTKRELAERIVSQQGKFQDSEIRREVLKFSKENVANSILELLAE